MNLPNSLTLVRMFLVPLLVVVLLTEFDNQEDMIGLSKEWLGAIIFAVASLTDWLDGYLARRRRQITRLGQIMDPIADKLLVCVLLIWFISLNDSLFYSIPTIVIITRELTISSMRQFLLEKKELKDLKVSYIARSKTTMQIICISLIIISPEFGDLFYSFALFLLCLTAMLSLFSFYDYMAKWFKDIF